MESPNLPEFLERGEPARLIPVVADSSKEQRAVSVLLATMQAVGEFGRSVIGMFGGPSGKSSRLSCFTEVVLKAPSGSSELRPDGLIVVEQGTRKWTAIVEAKIGTVELAAPQIEEYIDRARQAGIDALITVSNQYAGGAGGHPIAVDARKLRSFQLHHIPWMSLLAHAILLIEREGIDDTERAFIIREMIRFYQHEGSGVLQFSQMGPQWKDICGAVQQGLPLSKDSQQVRDTVANWMELTRYLEIPLSLAIRHPVTVRLSRDRSNDPTNWSSGLADMLVAESRLTSEFDIPDAASRLTITVDLRRRLILASMTLRAPTDRVRASACITWILKQLEKCVDGDVTIRAIWPRRMPDTMATLDTLRSNRDAIVPQGTDALPISFEVSRFVDLGAKFKSPRVMVESCERLAIDMYRSVGQHLKVWQAPAPKVKSQPIDPTEPQSSAAEAVLVSAPEASPDPIIPPPPKTDS